MKLYFSPGACSLSPHIALREAGVEPELVRVDLATKKLADGSDYLAINPKGYVPALQLDDGTLLTEGPAILLYIVQNLARTPLGPKEGMGLVRLVEWLNFIATEIHKGFSPLFKPNCPPEWKAVAKENLLKRLQWGDGQLAQRTWLLGEEFSVADVYLFVCTTWTAYVQIDLGQFPALARFAEKVSQRPAVQAALKAEGLKK